MPIAHLAWKSLWNRRETALLTLLSIALSVALLLGVERLRHEARTSFANTISGTDLIVGARGGAVPLLLTTVFHQGQPTHNIAWQSYLDIAAHPRVVWAVPLSLGDSHRGYPVLGTSRDYFRHYRFAHGRTLQFAAGRAFEDLYDAVLGAEVARRLDYRLDVPIVLTHGMSEAGFARHDDQPFRVVGILAPTGTPVDRAVHVSLEAIEAIHLNWRGGMPVPGHSHTAEQTRAMELTPRAITGALFGLESRLSTFRVKRFVNEYPGEPLTAIVPGVALEQLWALVEPAENALRAVSGFAVLVGLLGLLTALLASLQERRREIAILRSVGARSWQIFALILGEACFLTLVGMALGVALLSLLLMVARPWLANQLGLFLTSGWLSTGELRLLAAVLVASALAGAIPGYRAYRLALTDGLSPRI